MYSPANESEAVRTFQRSHIKRSILFFIILILLILGIALFAWLNGKTQAENAAYEKISSLETTIQELTDKIKELTDRPAVVDPVSPTIDLQVLYNKIENIGELATVEYLFTDSAQFNSSRHLLGVEVPFTKKTFILKWNGTIKAGVDLTKIQLKLLESETDDANAVKTVSVRVPAAKILSYEIDDDSVEILDESSNIFNPITIADKVAFDAATKDSMKSRAIENGLLKKAQENVEEILKQLILFDPEIEQNYTVKFVVTR